MYPIILALHIVTCILLIVSVLLQSGKGSSLSAAFGGGGEMFGPGTSATVMNKITTVLAAAFLILSLTLAAISTTKTSSSVIDRVTIPAPITNTEQGTADTQ